MIDRPPGPREHKCTLINLIDDKTVMMFLVPGDPAKLEAKQYLHGLTDGYLRYLTLSTTCSPQSTFFRLYNSTARCAEILSFLFIPPGWSQSFGRRARLPANAVMTSSLGCC